MLKKIACVRIALVLIMVCAKVCVDTFLERKMDRLTAEDYNRYVTNAYPDFDPSLYDPVSVHYADHGRISLLYVGPELLDPHFDPSIIDERHNEDVVELFHYNLFTNEVIYID